MRADSRAPLSAFKFSLLPFLWLKMSLDAVIVEIDLDSPCKTSPDNSIGFGFRSKEGSCEVQARLISIPPTQRGSVITHG